MLNGITEPQFGGREDWTPSAPPPPQQPPPGYAPPPFPPQYQPQYPPPPVGAYYDPSAPYGRHPLTGEPLSEKSKTIAGLLQFIGLFGLAGIGRIYLGYTGLGVAQLLVSLVTCGIGGFIWGIIDAILVLTDKVRDPQGRPLRDGT
jgi:TM2 domain-containing membrane protein YozV